MQPYLELKLETTWMPHTGRYYHLGGSLNYVQGLQPEEGSVQVEPIDALARGEGLTVPCYCIKYPILTRST